MPIDYSRYPSNWKDISMQIKTHSQWRCKECGLDCDPQKHLELNRSERARHTLTVHHQDYNPENNNLSNLIALCSACHLKKHIRRKGNISKGQLNLFD
jgi:predicted HNH restriction endonuclease